MATTLFKLVMNASTATSTDTDPAIKKYFYKLRLTERTSATITIPAADFTNDAGLTMTGNLTPATANNGYYLLFVNGVIQESSLFTVGSNGSNVNIIHASTVPISAPITLAVNNFAPNSTSVTTVTT
jgi:hypothetical protein